MNANNAPGEEQAEAGRAKSPEERIAGLESACAFYRQRLREVEGERDRLKEQVAHWKSLLKAP